MPRHGSSSSSRSRSHNRSAVDEAAAVSAVRRCAITAPDRAALNAAILDRIPATARLVLLGEASHGTRDFYDQRAELTKLLIAQRGFTAVLVESDWPDAFRVNRYVRGLHKSGGSQEKGRGAGSDQSAEEALGDYKRFPRWMWRNRSVASFIEWLRSHNLGLVPGADSARHAGAAAARVGFYGMDVYSLHSSAEAVLRYLRATDPQAARVVEARYRCFDRYGADAQSYGLATSMFHRASCEESVQRALYDVRRQVESYRSHPDGPASQEEALEVEANAMVVSGAEAYYRNMFTRDEITWNLRDTHFFETVQLVEKHITRLQRLAAERVQAGEEEPVGVGAMEMHGGGRAGTQQPKLVLWAHNSHLGDARHTDAGWRRGQLNIGQLVRQAYGDQAVLLGFTTHTGFVAAAEDWGEPERHKAVRPSIPGSYEHVMHSAVAAAAEEGQGERSVKKTPPSEAAGTGGGGSGSGGGGGCGDDEGDAAADGAPWQDPGRARAPLGGHFALDLHEPELAEALQGPLLERAIGVVYRPDTELQSHYFDALLPRQFDLLVHVETTSAVQPLDPPESWGGEVEWKMEATRGDMPELWPSGV